jgi:hypothetical protein
MIYLVGERPSKRRLHLPICFSRVRDERRRGPPQRSIGTRSLEILTGQSTLPSESPAAYLVHRVVRFGAQCLQLTLGYLPLHRSIPTSTAGLQAPWVRRRCRDAGIKVFLHYTSISCHARSLQNPLTPIPTMCNPRTFLSRSCTEQFVMCLNLLLTFHNSPSTSDGKVALAHF